MAEILPMHYALGKCESDEERAALKKAVDEGKITSWGSLGTTQAGRRLDRQSFDAWQEAWRKQSGGGEAKEAS